MKQFRGTVVLSVVMLVVSLVWIFPLIWLAGKAFTPNALVLRESARLFPSQWTLANFETVLSRWPYIRWLVNSVIVTSGAVVVIVLVSILAAYSFSRLRWKGRDVVFLLFLASMFIPWEINAIPLYFVANFLNLLNTYPGVFLPIASMPLGLFLLRQFLINIPQDIEDAARIDGCRSLGVLWRVFIPMSTPAIGAVVVWAFIFAWNEFFWSMISLQRSHMQTLPIGLKTIMGSQSIEYGMLFGSSLMAVLPSLVMFLLLRKQIIRGISISGSIK
jgi:multiple sugar transport system permease protein